MGDAVSVEENGDGLAMPRLERQRTPLGVDRIFTALDLKNAGEISLNNKRLIKLIRKVKFPSSLSDMGDRVRRILDGVSEGDSKIDEKANFENLKDWFKRQKLDDNAAKELIIAIGKAKQELYEEEMSSVPGILSLCNLEEYTEIFKKTEIKLSYLRRVTTREEELELIKITGLKPGHMVRLRRGLLLLRTQAEIKNRKLSATDFVVPPKALGNAYQILSRNHVSIFPDGRYSFILDEDATISQAAYDGIVFKEYRVRGFARNYLQYGHLARNQKPFFAVGIEPIIPRHPNSYRTMITFPESCLNKKWRKFPRVCMWPNGNSLRVCKTRRSYVKKIADVPFDNFLDRKDDKKESMILSVLINLAEHKMFVYLNGKLVNKKALRLHSGVKARRVSFIVNCSLNFQIESLPCNLKIPNFAKDKAAKKWSNIASLLKKTSVLASCTFSVAPLLFPLVWNPITAERMQRYTRTFGIASSVVWLYAIPELGPSLNSLKVAGALVPLIFPPVEVFHFIKSKIIKMFNDMANVQWSVSSIFSILFLKGTMAHFGRFVHLGNLYLVTMAYVIPNYQLDPLAHINLSPLSNSQLTPATKERLKKWLIYNVILSIVLEICYWYFGIKTPIWSFLLLTCPFRLIKTLYMSIVIALLYSSWVDYFLMDPTYAKHIIDKLLGAIFLGAIGLVAFNFVSPEDLPFWKDVFAHFLRPGCWTVFLSQIYKMYWKQAGNFSNRQTDHLCLSFIFNVCIEILLSKPDGMLYPSVWGNFVGGIWGRVSSLFGY